jgi:methylase of polypeptide subunit release factors
MWMLMLNLLPVESSLRLRAFFEEAGYTETNLRKHLGAAELPSRHLRNLARLSDRTSANTRLNLLLRWFWLGNPQARGDAAELMPEEMLALLLEAGLLLPDDGNLAPSAMILHIDGFLVASDHPIAIENKQAEMVLWPNPTSKFLARFAVRRRSRATLDLGTGSGILSLGAAGYSDTVVATDLNPRAVSCARFNARLNGVENIEVLAGDCFLPVAGRRFDLILSNPPFFITPQADYLFCDNPMDLDGLCRRLVKEAPPNLAEDGYMQMLCEWAQIKGQPWEERLAEWLEGTGCDGWVMKGLTQDPEEYAQHRIREISKDASQDSAHYDGYMSYYRHRGVEAIHDGMVVMRRREGKNFVRIEEVPKAPSGNLGEMILSTFAAHDFLRENGGTEKLLTLCPKLSPYVRLEQSCTPIAGKWQAECLSLHLTSGFQAHLTVQPLVAEFLANCDGTRSLGEAIQQLADKADAGVDKVRAECVAMVRHLIERGFMVTP